MKVYGLIGFPLAHSLSPAYFTRKFNELQLKDHDYKLFPMTDLAGLRSWLTTHPEICGLNVTVPYKEEVISFLDQLDETAGQIRAVNCIRIIRLSEGIHLTGFNTDGYGFEKAFTSVIRQKTDHALILGTGGSAKAVSFALNKSGIRHLMVSRKPVEPARIGYDQLTPKIVRNHLLIINTTPLGMFPDSDLSPPIPYQYLTSSHILIDLVYNPEETEFLKKGKLRGAITFNGLQMLHSQADKSWEIWTDLF